jgi:hypothetical protein
MTFFAGLQGRNVIGMPGPWLRVVQVAAEAAPTAPGFDRCVPDRRDRCGSGFSPDGDKPGTHR